MPGITEISTDRPLYTYVIASGDMRYIEINQRDLYLRQDPNLGLILRGELPGCGAGCYADLSQVLLEYAMTCEGCKTPQQAGEYVAEFGARLGEVLAPRLAPGLTGQAPEEHLSAAFEFLLKSMAVPFTTWRSQDQLRFTLEYCPLCDSGSRSGMSRELALARLGFAALCQGMLHALAPDWKLLTPSLDDYEHELLEILLAKN